jgi:REP element-mobilizing transposase RayT
MPERLGRLKQLWERHPIYFVTAGTAERKALLARAPVHESFRSFGKNAPAHGAWLGAYVIMPDHLHLFIALDDELMTLSRWMKSLKNTISKSLRDANVPSPHWQKGFFDHVLRSGESYSQKWEYVRENPVRAGLVSRWEDWPYLGEMHELEYRRDRFAL